MDIIKVSVLAIALALVAGCASDSNPTGAAVQEEPAADVYRVAVAADGDTGNSRVSQGIGKAMYFLIYEDGELAGAVEGFGRSSCGEAGQMMVEGQVDAVVCARFGEKIAEILKQEGIEMIRARRNKKAGEIIAGLGES